MNVCSVCEKEYENKYFDEEQNKCILHCEKNEDNDWYKLDESNCKEWNDDKVNKFWTFIQINLDKDYRNYIIDTDLVEMKYALSYVYFPKFQEEVEYFSPAMNEDEMGTNFYSYDVFEQPNQQPMPKVNQFFEKFKISFDNCIFLDIANFKKYYLEDDIYFENCKFKDKLLLNKIYKNKVEFYCCTFAELNCYGTVFQKQTTIMECKIIGKSNFINTEFKGLADFSFTTFNYVEFDSAVFEKIAIFNSVVFSEDLEFDYTKFIGKVIFRYVVFKGKLNLANTIFDDEANFLDISSELRNKKTIQVENRETARIIKNFFDKANNIIEANKFYALEMKEREKELNKDKKNIFFDWLIVKIHGVTSNYSQDWYLPLFWILLLSTLYTFEQDGIKFLTVFIYFVFLSIFILYIFRRHRKITIFYEKSLLFVLIILNYYFIDLSKYFSLYNNFESIFIFLDDIAKNMNIFLKFNIEDMTMGLLLYKVVLSYLVYQFIVSVRQNTRRK